MYIAGCYLGYIAISIALTVWVARTLQRSGRVFLLDACRGNVELADSVSRLLTIGFYLINVGYIVWSVNTNYPLNDLRQVAEMETTKLGAILLIQGIMHTINIFVLTRIRRFGSASAA